MPEAVEEFGKHHNPELVRIIQQTILESYQNDMGNIINRVRFQRYVSYIRISVRSLQRRIRSSNIRISSRVVELLNLRELLNGFVLQV